LGREKQSGEKISLHTKVCFVEAVKRAGSSYHLQRALVKIDQDAALEIKGLGEGSYF
jgi:hypothetical protein